MAESIFLSVDSDVLRALSCVENHKRFYFRIQEIEDENAQRYFPDLVRFLRRMDNGDFKILVTSTVFCEVRHRESVVKFILEKCYFPRRDITNFVEKMQQTEELAKKYCSSFVDKAGRECLPLMQIVYNPHNQQYMPTTDAYIMAESTIENACVITNNYKDYVGFRKFKNGIAPKNSSRARGITIINSQFLGQDKNLPIEERYIPRPYSLEYFIETYLDKDLSQWPFEKQKEDSKIAAKESALGVEIGINK